MSTWFEQFAIKGGFLYTTRVKNIKKWGNFDNYVIWLISVLRNCISFAYSNMLTIRFVCMYFRGAKINVMNISVYLYWFIICWSKLPLYFDKYCHDCGATLIMSTSADNSVILLFFIHFIIYMSILYWLKCNLIKFLDCIKCNKLWWSFDQSSPEAG